MRTAFLADENSGERYTDMRANQLVADCWRVAATAGQQLRFLAFKQVTEVASLAAMEEERDAQIGEGTVTAAAFKKGQAIECTEESNPYWRDNVWLRCSGRVAEALSGDAQRIVVSKAFIRNDRPSSAMDLIVELTAVQTEASGEE